MARRAVLRFKDTERSSIEEHQRIAAARGSVWWGWWKKEHEPFNQSLLDFVRQRTRGGTLRVGLVNRVEMKFYAAHCVAVMYQADGAPLPCPDPQGCPAYYRQEHLSAWFRFERIEELTPDTYRSEFGPAPVGDPTMFDVTIDKKGVRFYPQPSWQTEPVKAPGDYVLHISDLHFGEDHGFREFPAAPGTAVPQATLAEVLTHRIVDERGWRIGVVVVTGDLTTWQSRNFSLAKEFLLELVAGLDLERKHVVIVPGNHDIPLITEAHPSRDYGHEKPFRDFLEGFYLQESEDLERIQRFVTPGGWDISFLALNSCRLRKDSLKEYGYVGRDRYEQMLEYLVKTLRGPPRYSERKLIVALLHHHLLPVNAVDLPDEERPTSLTLDAGELIDVLQANGVRLALHGHQHIPFVGKVNRASRSNGALAWSEQGTSGLYVIGCGGTGVKQTRLWQDELRNSYGVYTPTDEGLAVEIEAFSPGTPVRTSGNLLLRMHEG